MAYQMGDFAWSASLLQEAVRKITDDPELLYETAEALYSLGRVEEAETSMRDALNLTEVNPSAPPDGQSQKLFTRAEQARRFLEMTGLSANPVLTATGRVEQLLKIEPDHVPALMALGAINEKRLDAVAAQITYEKALARFPDFTPAKLRLAVLGASKAEYDQKAYDLAQQARTAYPNDPELAKALGILLYRKGGEYNRAVNLLKQSSVSRTNDAELMYYLGLAQFQAKDLAGSRQSLQKSLDLGLRPDLATEARKALSRLK